MNGIWTYRSVFAVLALFILALFGMNGCNSGDESTASYYPVDEAEKVIQIPILPEDEKVEESEAAYFPVEEIEKSIRIPVLATNKREK